MGAHDISQPVEASWIARTASYVARELAALFAQYPALWFAAAVAGLAAWKLAEILIWLFSRGLRLGVAAALLAAGLALYGYVHRG